MFRRFSTYLAATLVFVASLLTTLYLPLGELFRSIAATPAVGALFVVLYQILKDQAAFERALIVQDKEQLFALGVTSHMANVAFDRHVQFCEEYITEVHGTMSDLFREGPTPQALQRASNLAQIRHRHAAWMTTDIVAALDGFEAALRKLGSRAGYVASTAGYAQYDGARIKASEDADELWGKLFGKLLDKSAEEDEAVAVERVKDRLREVLGIEKLHSIRKWIVDRAVRGLS